MPWEKFVRKERKKAYKTLEELSHSSKYSSVAYLHVDTACRDKYFGEHDGRKPDDRADAYDKLQKVVGHRLLLEDAARKSKLRPIRKVTAVS